MKKQKLIIITLILLLLCGITALTLIHVKNTAKKVATSTSTGPTKDEKAAEDKVNAENKDTYVKSDDPAQTGSSTPPSNISITLKKDGSSLVVITKLTNYSDGDCELDVTNGDVSKIYSAKVIYQPEASTCAGFSVPIDQIGKGNWNIKLKVTSGGVTNSETVQYAST